MNIIKSTTLALSLMLSLTLYAQDWEKVETVDEFGDSTGESVLRLLVNGKFSNSATVGSDLIVKVVDYGDAAIFTLYEYGSSPASMGYKGNLGSIKVKLASGEVVKFNCFAPKSGGIYFGKEDYTALFKYLKDGTGSVMKFLVNEEDFSEYGNATYKFSITSLTAAQVAEFGE